MPMMIMGQPEGAPERKHFTHKRLERWIRLQQFVYGLPDDYAYAVCITEKNGKAESHALVTVGWMTWFGYGKGPNRQHSLALALLEASEALSSNSTKVFFHGLRRLLWRSVRPAKAKAPEAEASEQRLAS